MENKTLKNMTGAEARCLRRPIQQSRRQSVYGPACGLDEFLQVAALVGGPSVVRSKQGLLLGDL